MWVVGGQAFGSLHLAKILVARRITWNPEKGDTWGDRKKKGWLKSSFTAEQNFDGQNGGKPG